MYPHVTLYYYYTLQDVSVRHLSDRRQPSPTLARLASLLLPAVVRRAVHGVADQGGRGGGGGDA